MKKFLVFSLLVLGVCIVLVIIKEHKSTKNLISNNSDSKTSKYQTSESVQTASEKTTSESQPAAYSSEKITSESQYTLEDYIREHDGSVELPHIDDESGVTVNGFDCECVGNILYICGTLNLEIDEEPSEAFQEATRETAIKKMEGMEVLLKLLEEETGVKGVILEMVLYDKNGKVLFDEQFNREGVIQ